MLFQLQSTKYPKFKHKITFFWASFCNFLISSIKRAFVRRTSAFIATALALFVSLAAISAFYKKSNNKIQNS